MVPTAISEQTSTHGLLDVLIRAGLIAVFAVACYQVFQPFRDLLLWSLILAVTFYPLHRQAQRQTGHRRRSCRQPDRPGDRGLLMVPIYLLGTSIADSVEGSLALAKRVTGSCPRRPIRSPGLAADRTAPGRLLATSLGQPDQPAAHGPAGT